MYALHFVCVAEPYTSDSVTPNLPSADVTWHALSQLLVDVATSVVGTRRHTQLWTPYTPADKTELLFLQQRVADTYEQLSQAATVKVFVPAHVCTTYGIVWLCNTTVR